MSPFFCKALVLLVPEKTFFFFGKGKLFSNYKSINFSNRNYGLIMNLTKRNQITSVFFIYLIILLPAVRSFESRDYLEIDMLIKSCYKHTESCLSSLYKINQYQKNAAKNKKLSCQTSLLGLEGNLIMAMKNNLKRKEAKIISNAVKKYC